MTPEPPTTPPDPPAQPARDAETAGPQLLKGVAGLVKAALRQDRAPETTITQRRRTCATCPHLIRMLGAPVPAGFGLTATSRCARCQCFVIAKSALNHEKCPDGRW